MFRKMVFLTMIASIFVWIALLIPAETGQAHAQEAIPPEDSACRHCHEERYYLYDSGNWYCLHETKVGCTDCHRGNPDTTVQACAHAGLIANPLVNDGAVCQKCHPNDYRARVQTYVSIVGIHPTPRPYATCTPSTGIPKSGEKAGRTRLLRALPAGTWQAAGFSFLGVAFLVLFLFACRCWKADRYANIRHESKFQLR